MLPIVLVIQLTCCCLIANINTSKFSVFSKIYIYLFYSTYAFMFDLSENNLNNHNPTCLLASMDQLWAIRKSSLQELVGRLVFIRPKNAG